jgi:uncharacterized protein (DUF433 family)
MKQKYSHTVRIERATTMIENMFEDLEKKHPLIERNPHEMGPMNVRVRRTKTPVWAVVGNLMANNWDLKESEGAYLLTAEEVAAVVRYYEEYGSFIDARLTENLGGEEMLTKKAMRKVS